MVRIYKTIDGAIHQIQEPEEGCWIALTNPTATEIFEFSEKFDIEVDDLRSPLDEEERSRIEVEDNYTLILVDVPMIEERNDKDWYGTIPLGIIVTGSMIFTICLEDTPVLTRFMEGRVRSFFTYMKTRFIFQILYRNASMYLRYLRIIDKKSEQVEEKLHLSTRNEELIELLERAALEGRHDFVNDILIRYKNLKRIYGYKTEDYWSNISDAEAYYRTNMAFLQPEIRNYFFRQEPGIKTKIDDLPPAKYNPGAEVKNSLVASGCIINGTVENSVLFKSVYVGNNCVIRNSVILNDVYIGDNTVIENCIVESRDTIRANSSYKGEDGKVRIVVEKNERYGL